MKDKMYLISSVNGLVRAEECWTGWNPDLIFGGALALTGVSLVISDVTCRADISI